MSAGRKSNELKIIRIYDAPPEVVWDAWADPEQVAQWWGPRGFTITTEKKDLRPGGSWRYTMHGPDGVDYPNVTKYFEVEKPRKLVYDHGGSDDRPPLFRVTVLFTPVGKKTRMEMTMTLPTAEAAEEARKFVKKANGNSTWDRLAEYLDKNSTGRERFIINRTFDAPVATVFEMWTNPDQSSQWLPPAQGEFQHREVSRLDRIVYSQGAMLTTVLFNEEPDGCTRVTVVTDPQGTPEEIGAFVRSRPAMMQGWYGSFDKLETLLA